MAAARILARISRQGIASAAAGAARWRPEAASLLEASALAAAEPCASIKPARYSTLTFQRFGFSTSASQQDDKEANKHTDDGGNKSAGPNTEASTEANNTPETEKAHEAGSQDSVSQCNRRGRAAKRTAFSDSDSEDLDLSKEDLVKLLLEKDESLKSKDQEVKEMKDKVLRSYAEMENVIARTKRESENSKKYAIQSFSKSLLDVADNLSRASSVVKESFSKIDTPNDSDEAVVLLKTLLEGVEMTEKQLGEVFKKFGVEKFDPLNEKFDPNSHYALFQIPDPSKQSGTIAAVVKVGYMLHDRVLRPAEVGVTEGGPTEEEPEEKSSKSE
ncbi:grpE protein homolog 2, mitochondrial-like isoform X2 [Phragmites australis]|uniref:grpE protein homolog 2, mitochondrial-like isoform X2 n=1 Tax=Phragmites australis TaxID=29695 RepID=UPI002D78B778|nr:grpE protein homolog 2, mitochondrial-like isoform X2 [Phragmites australis]